MKAEIEKSRVLEAASKCPTAKETLKVLFPEFFEEDKSVEIELKDDYFIEKGCRNSILNIRSGGKYKSKAFYIDDFYNWRIEKDPSGNLCLIPTKK